LIRSLTDKEQFIDPQLDIIKYKIKSEIGTVNNGVR